MRQILPDSVSRAAQFQPITSSEALNDRGVRIVAVPVANEHADGSVAYYLPASRILLQGDLFYVPERARCRGHLV